MDRGSLGVAEMINKCTSTVGKCEGKRPLWNPRHTWQDNIKMNLKEKWCNDVNLVQLSG
jgi:hypothetical protein